MSEEICIECKGTGTLDGKECKECNGFGRKESVNK